MDDKTESGIPAPVQPQVTAPTNGPNPPLTLNGQPIDQGNPESWPQIQ